MIDLLHQRCGKCPDLAEDELFMQREKVATTDGGIRTEPRTGPLRRVDVHQYLGRVAADKTEVRRQHGNDGMIQQSVPYVRLHNEHRPHFRTARVAKRLVHDNHVAAPVDHWSALSCQSSGSSSANSGYMSSTSC